MDLERFKRLEAEVVADLYDYIRRTKTIFGFNPKYGTTDKIVPNTGVEGTQHKSRTSTRHRNFLPKMSFKTDYSLPLDPHSYAGYKLLTQFAWR